MVNRKSLMYNLLIYLKAVKPKKNYSGFDLYEFEDVVSLLLRYRKKVWDHYQKFSGIKSNCLVTSYTVRSFFSGTNLMVKYKKKAAVLTNTRNVKGCVYSN